MSNNNLEGVLTIKDTEGALVAIVYNDLSRRSQVFYRVTECGAEDIKNLLDDLKESSAPIPNTLAIPDFLRTPQER